MTQSNRAVLQAIEYHLPEARVTNDALAEQFPEWTPARIHEIVGVDERHVAASDECASDLAVAAATKLFASGRASPADIDYVIHCTQAPDYFLPTTACVIQNRLGLPRHCGAVDINLGCSGYVVRPRSGQGPDRIRAGEPRAVSYSGHVQQVSSTRATRAFGACSPTARRPRC